MSCALCTDSPILPSLPPSFVDASRSRQEDKTNQALEAAAEAEIAHRFPPPSLPPSFTSSSSIPPPDPPLPLPLTEIPPSLPSSLPPFLL